MTLVNLDLNDGTCVVQPEYWYILDKLFVIG